MRLGKSRVVLLIAAGVWMVGSFAQAGTRPGTRRRQLQQQQQQSFYYLPATGGYSNPQGPGANGNDTPNGAYNNPNSGYAPNVKLYFDGNTTWQVQTAQLPPGTACPPGTFYGYFGQWYCLKDAATNSQPQGPDAGFKKVEGYDDLHQDQRGNLYSLTKTPNGNEYSLIQPNNGRVVSPALDARNESPLGPKDADPNIAAQARRYYVANRDKLAKQDQTAYDRNIAGIIDPTKEDAAKYGIKQVGTTNVYTDGKTLYVPSEDGKRLNSLYLDDHRNTTGKDDELVFANNKQPSASDIVAINQFYQDRFDTLDTETKGRVESLNRSEQVKKAKEQLAAAAGSAATPPPPPPPIDGGPPSAPEPPSNDGPPPPPPEPTNPPAATESEFCSKPANTICSEYQKLKLGKELDADPEKTNQAIAAKDAEETKNLEETAFNKNKAAFGAKGINSLANLSEKLAISAQDVGDCVNEEARAAGAPTCAKVYQDAADLYGLYYSAMTDESDTAENGKANLALSTSIKAAKQIYGDAPGATSDEYFRQSRYATFKDLVLMAPAEHKEKAIAYIRLAAFCGPLASEKQVFTWGNFSTMCPSSVKDLSRPDSNGVDYSVARTFFQGLQEKLAADGDLALAPGTSTAACLRDTFGTAPYSDLLTNKKGEPVGPAGLAESLIPSINAAQVLYAQLEKSKNSTYSTPEKKLKFLATNFAPLCQEWKQGTEAAPQTTPYYRSTESQRIRQAHQIINSHEGDTTSAHRSVEVDDEQFKDSPKQKTELTILSLDPKIRDLMGCHTQVPKNAQGGEFKKDGDKIKYCPVQKLP